VKEESDIVARNGIQRKLGTISGLGWGVRRSSLILEAIPSTYFYTKECYSGLIDSVLTLPLYNYEASLKISVFYFNLDIDVGLEVLS
jgi:hypothetical protein